MDEARYRAAEQALWNHWGVTPAERWVRFGADGPRLRVLEAGDPDGQPLLFLHGAAVAATCWADLASRLQDHRCLLLDRPGCGLSEPITPPPSLEELPAIADGLAVAVLDELGVDRAHLVANSMGGYFALRAAAAHPDRVASVTELGWCLGAPVHRLPVFMRLATHRLLTPLAARVPATRASVKAMLRATGLAEAIDTGRIPPAGIDWNVAVQNQTDTRRHEFSLGNGAGLGEQMATLEHTSDVLQRITAPVQIIFGPADPFGTVETMRALADAIPDGRLEVWDDAGHAPWLDDLDRAEAAVRSSIASGSRSGMS